MKKNPITILILAILLPLPGFSQNNFLDFIITKKNDTIYGTIRNVISTRGVLYEKSVNTKKDRIKFHSHKLKDQKKIRYNDEIYRYVKPSSGDGIYAAKTETIIPKDSIAKRLGDFINIQKRLPDYVVTNETDTVYGNIEQPIFAKLRLLDSSGTKIKIDKELITSYRFKNEVYEYKEKRRATLFDDKNAYLKLVIDGNVKLYEYDTEKTEIDMNSGQASKHSGTYYYVEKDNELVLINSLLYKKTLAELFSDNQILVSKILNEEYVIDNIYLIIKYYNGNK